MVLLQSSLQCLWLSSSSSTSPPSPFSFLASPTILRLPLISDTTSCFFAFVLRSYCTVFLSPCLHVSSLSRRGPLSGDRSHSRFMGGSESQWKSCRVDLPQVEGGKKVEEQSDEKDMGMSYAPGQKSFFRARMSTRWHKLWNMYRTGRGSSTTQMISTRIAVSQQGLQWLRMNLATWVICARRATKLKRWRTAWLQYPDLDSKIDVTGKL